jgi:hypothetical protein
MKYDFFFVMGEVCGRVFLVVKPHNLKTAEEILLVNFITMCAISGFRCIVDEICAALGHYTTA